jgi:hypothetical protein
MKFHLDNLITEFEALEAELADPAIYSDVKRFKTINQKKKWLEKTVELYREYKMLYANYDELKTLVTNEKDPEMLEMMKSEIALADKRIPELEESIKIALLPKDPTIIRISSSKYVPELVVMRQEYLRMNSPRLTRYLLAKNDTRSKWWVKHGMMQEGTKNEFSKSKVVLGRMRDSNMNQGYIEYSVFQLLRRMDVYIHRPQQLPSWSKLRISISLSVRRILRYLLAVHLVLEDSMSTKRTPLSE